MYVNKNILWSYNIFKNKLNVSKLYMLIKIIIIDEFNSDTILLILRLCYNIISIWVLKFLFDAGINFGNDSHL